MIEAFASVVSGVLVALVVFVAVIAAVVMVRAVRATHGGESLPGGAPQFLLFAFVLALLGGAALGVGKALELLTEGWAAVVGIVGTFFGGWLGYKAATKITAKGSTIDVGPPAGGGTT